MISIRDEAAEDVRMLAPIYMPLRDFEVAACDRLGLTAGFSLVLLSQLSGYADPEVAA